MCSHLRRRALPSLAAFVEEGPATLQDAVRAEEWLCNELWHAAGLALADACTSIRGTERCSLEEGPAEHMGIRAHLSPQSTQSPTGPSVREGGVDCGTDYLGEVQRCCGGLACYHLGATFGQPELLAG